MAAIARQQPWSTEAPDQLATDPSPILARWAKVIDACVQQTDLRNEPLFVLATDEVPDVTDVTVSQWQHAARQVSVEFRKRFADTAPRWTYGRHKGGFKLPLDLISGRNLKADKDQLYVGVTPEEARRWKEATGATT